MIYPNGFITLRKLEKMIDDPNNWKIIARYKLSEKKITLTNIDDLKKYLFNENYSIGYEFIGENWIEYNKPKEGILFDWKKDDLELKVIEKENKISAELLKWENNSIDSEDLPICFVLASWDKDKNLRFVGDRFFEYVSTDILLEVYQKIKDVQSLLDSKTGE